MLLKLKLSLKRNKKVAAINFVSETRSAAALTQAAPPTPRLAPPPPKRPAPLTAAPAVEPIAVSPPAKKPKTQLTLPERVGQLEGEVESLTRALVASKTLLKRHEGICNHYWAFQRTIANSQTTCRPDITLRELMSDFFDNPKYAQKGFEDLEAMARKAGDQDRLYQQRADLRDVAAQLEGMDGKSNLH